MFLFCKEGRWENKINNIPIYGGRVRRKGQSPVFYSFFWRRPLVNCVTVWREFKDLLFWMKHFLLKKMLNLNSRNHSWSLAVLAAKYFKFALDWGLRSESKRVKKTLNMFCIKSRWFINNILCFGKNESCTILQ